jgi:hypothetical protein
VAAAQIPDEPVTGDDHGSGAVVTQVPHRPQPALLARLFATEELD